MNIIWSEYVQGINTLYYSRKLRFNDMFSKQYTDLFSLNPEAEMRILEIGCGPGALAGALRRWYPKAEITAIDRDSNFIHFAKTKEPGITFLEGDATALPFDDNMFDVTISNTVAEHIEPSRFYGEQFRVLKPGGVCLVLSSRKGIHVEPNCITLNEYENQFWSKAERYDSSAEKYSVCKYPMSESELPETMEKYGFRDIMTGYAAIDLTPDNPKFSSVLAHDMINSARYTALDAIDSVLHTMPEHFTMEEAEEMKRLANAKYDMRIRQYDCGEKQWDTTVSIIMVVRGIK
ncbi:MAG: class I SAM-dependent methyltransferase [Lachnospiraceae bacterium]|nr:class I SAM-dependent methyltransferase [Lachnospiraceae bacterium]